MPLRDATLGQKAEVAHLWAETLSVMGLGWSPGVLLCGPHALGHVAALSSWADELVYMQGLWKV